MTNKTEHIEQLILRSIQGNASVSETQELNEWRTAAPENETWYQDLNDTWNCMNDYVPEFDSQKGWDTFLVKKTKKTPRAIWNVWLKVAAVAACVTIGILMYANNNFKAPAQIEHDIVWKTAEGEIISLEQLNENPTSIKNEEVVINVNQYLDAQKSDNEIIVPKGKRVKLLLEDGSIVWLSAETKFKFPASFHGENERIVAVEGEAFFDVSRNEKQPFRVKSTSTEIVVLGTRFNVDNTTRNIDQTTLVSGKVNIEMQGEVTAELTPSEQFTFNGNEMILENVNTDTYVAWTQGSLLFDDIPFPELKKKLERWYGVVITNNNTKLQKQRFSGEFNKNDDIESVMSLLKISNQINYSVKNNIVNIY
ncbi:FecR family protein [Flammeovirga pacifica]|uniref:FecR protein domain-containing protein n=1 Tax=Flammeovirga pacifica TaxID=915059 RepID=A0A1S1YTH0_FLAPC|nr:FecR domain-containing protein [Flammeovirga pacifica]OHX64308.1 hypothetical protein NH26_22190 [Flammeovirga pacifica]